jgi:hypothetical protein
MIQEENKKILQTSRNADIILTVVFAMLSLVCVWCLTITNEIVFLVVFAGLLVFCIMLTVCGIIEITEKTKKIKEFDTLVKGFEELDKKFEEARVKMEEKMMERKIYNNLSFRDRVLKDKFFGITNKKLQEAFLNENVGIWTTVEDAIKQFERYNFDYRVEFEKVLESFQEKQAILNMYAGNEKVKSEKTKKECKKRGRPAKVIQPVKAKRGRPRKKA